MTHTAMVFLVHRHPGPADAAGTGGREGQRGPHQGRSRTGCARTSPSWPPTECEGRGPPTKGINLAADYIAAEFKKAGLQAGRQGRHATSSRSRIPGAALEHAAPLVLRGPHGQKIELKPGVALPSAGHVRHGQGRGRPAGLRRLRHHQPPRTPTTTTTRASTRPARSSSCSATRRARAQPRVASAATGGGATARSPRSCRTPRSTRPSPSSSSTTGTPPRPATTWSTSTTPPPPPARRSCPPST